MYLFTRQARLSPGSLRLGTEWAVGITEKVNQITSLDVGLWSPILSPGVGTLSYGAAVEHLSDLEDGDAKLNADPIFVDMVERGAAYLQPGTGIEDQAAQFIANPPSDARTSHVAVVTSTITNGHFAKGVEVGVEIAQRATEVGGLPTAFLLSTTGTYAGCAWITSGNSMQELEAGEQKVNGDPAFITLLDAKAADCFVQGATEQTLWRRIV